MTTGKAPDPEREPLGDCAHELGLVLAHMSDLVAMLDTSGRRLYNSPSYGKVFGDRDLTGTDSFPEIHPDDRERVKQVFREKG